MHDTQGVPCHDIKGLLYYTNAYPKARGIPDERKTQVTARNVMLFALLIEHVCAA
jgi:hypothetical protein